MTDNEIIKALDFCEGYNGVSFCNDCPLFEEDNCIHILARETRNLINRQKAEIERYKGVIKILEKDVKTAKSEAYKEFAERLKEGEVYMRIEFPNTRSGTETYVVLSEDIDNLVKEMDGGK